MTVSSANFITFAFLKQAGKSLKLIKNNRGPKIDPCGMPHVTGLPAETSLS